MQRLWIRLLRARYVRRMRLRVVLESGLLGMVQTVWRRRAQRGGVRLRGLRRRVRSMSRRCGFCGEVYGERDCRCCGRGMCDLCDTEDQVWAQDPVCWDCRREQDEALRVEAGRHGDE